MTLTCFECNEAVRDTINITADRAG